MSTSLSCFDSKSHCLSWTQTQEDKRHFRPVLSFSFCLNLCCTMDRTICTLLLLLSLPPIVHGEDFALAPIELAPIPCNDKAVEKLSRLAVTYINEDRTDGYKFALNRIANVHLHAQVSTEINAQQERVPEVVVISCQWESASCFTKELGWRGYFSSVVTEITKQPC